MPQIGNDHRCNTCLFLSYDWKLDWTRDNNNDIQMFIQEDRYCDICDVFKRTDGYCDFWEAKCP